METQRSGARYQHRRAVLELLHSGLRLTRSELAKELGVNRTTISEVLTELRDEGAIVVADSRAAEGRGRRAEVLSLHPGAVRYVGMDYSHSRVLVCLANASGDVIAQGTAPYTENDGWERRCRRGTDLVRDLAQGPDIHLQSLNSMAIGLPGPNAASWTGGLRTLHPTEPFHLVRARIREVFTAEFGVSVYVDHHIRFAALSEAEAQYTPAPDNLIFLRLSNGVGGAIVHDGRVPQGSHKLAGEIGHLIMDRTNEARSCRCGRAGCLETIASINGILTSWRNLGHNADRFDEFKAALADGHPDASTLMDKVAATVGRALGVACLVTDPEAVILGGEVGQLLMARADLIQGKLDAEVLSPQEVSIRHARLGEEAGARGAIVALMADNSRPVNQPKEIA